jgi:hypothetical protein
LSFVVVNTVYSNTVFEEFLNLGKVLVSKYLGLKVSVRVKCTVNDLIKKLASTSHDLYHVHPLQLNQLSLHLKENFTFGPQPVVVKPLRHPHFFTSVLELLP